MRLLDATAVVFGPEQDSNSRASPVSCTWAGRFVTATLRRRRRRCTLGGAAAPGHCQTGEPESTFCTAARHSQDPQPATVYQGARAVNPSPHIAASPGGYTLRRTRATCPQTMRQVYVVLRCDTTSSAGLGAALDARVLAPRIRPTMPNRCALGVAHISSARRMRQVVNVGD
jgi:hypothetical protein